MSQSNKFSNIDCSGLLKNEGSTQPIEIKDFMTIKFGSSVVLNDYITLNAEISSHIGYLKLDGSIDYILEMECSRCLELDKQHNSSNISAVFTNDNEDDALVIQENKSLNLDGLIADIITESLDMKYICFEDCLGLCSDCGENKNITKCGHSSEKNEKKLKENPFSLLNELDLKVE